MRFMNDFDIEMACRRYAHQPNRLEVIEAVDALRVWADRNSDGWAYWPKPARAAARAMEAIEGDGTSAAWDRDDLFPGEVTSALRPIKAFLTRQGTSLGKVLDQYAGLV